MVSSGFELDTLDATCFPLATIAERSLLEKGNPILCTSLLGGSVGLGERQCWMVLQLRLLDSDARGLGLLL